MFKKEMKSTIMFAVVQDITGLSTKKGYNGAPILSICADTYDKLMPMQDWCSNLGYSSKIISNDSDIAEVFKEKLEWCLYIVFGEDEIDEEFFKLKN